jgi:putative spermidine/putrescine transport system substrate-binding protein
MVWDGHVFDLDAWAVLKGAPNKATAMKFVKFATGSKPLSGMQDVAYGPTRESSMVYVDDAVKGQLPSANLDVGLRASGDFWSDYGESYGEKFNEWLLK